jgi:hypothetical protein
MIHRLNCERGKRCSLPKCPDQLLDPPSLPQLHIQWVMEFLPRDKATRARRWPLTSIQWVELHLYSPQYAFIALEETTLPS